MSTTLTPVHDPKLLDTPYTPRASVIRGVEKQHTSRTLHDLDAASTLAFVNEGANKTAHWTFDGSAHHIVVNQELVCLISNPNMLMNRRHKRKELQYVRSVHNHEVAHGLYTSRDFKGINMECKRLGVPFRDVNLFEDARIEGLMRQRRPIKVAPKGDIGHDGARTEPQTYGVRKFEWMKWDSWSLDSPRSAFLSFIKCEGTSKHLDGLAQYWADCFGSLLEGFESSHPRAHMRSTWGYQKFLDLWRKVAGRGADRRFPTTASLFPVLAEFNKHFPISEDEEGRGIPGIGGSDYEESAKEAGEEPHRENAGSGGGTKPTPEPKPEAPTKRMEGVHDKKSGDRDESKDDFVPKETIAELDPQYFTFDLS